MRALDDWRAGRMPRLSRSEAIRLLLEERLGGDRATEGWDAECGVLPDAARLGALYALERVSGFGPVKFRTLHEAGIEPSAVLARPEILPFKGRTGDKLRRGIEALSATDLAAVRARAEDQMARARAIGASILTHGDLEYPKRVYASNNPVPVLYVRGDPSAWESESAVAVVGSRNTREPYASAARAFAAVAAQQRVLVVSGFAMGADSIGHQGALAPGGKTVCVMPCGLDNVFPPENRVLWQKLLAEKNAVFVTEFSFGQRASSLLLRKRNKLIVAFVQGVVVVQSEVDGGAMNAYRFAREQRKPVAAFVNDGSRDTTGNAAIGNDARTGGFVLSSTGEESEYEAWLQKVSCRI